MPRGRTVTQRGVFVRTGRTEGNDPVRVRTGCNSSTSAPPRTRQAVRSRDRRVHVGYALVFGSDRRRPAQRSAPHRGVHLASRLGAADPPPVCGRLFLRDPAALGGRLLCRHDHRRPPARCTVRRAHRADGSRPRRWQRLLARLLRGRVTSAEPRRGTADRGRRPCPGCPGGCLPGPGPARTAGPKRSSEPSPCIQRRCRPVPRPSSACRGPIGDWGAAHHRTRGQHPSAADRRPAHRDGRRTSRRSERRSPFRPAAFGLGPNAFGATSMPSAPTR